MNVSIYSLELTIDAGHKGAKAFRAIKRFDSSFIMGTTLQLMREQRPLDLHLDRADRSALLRRINDLLGELEELGIPFFMQANNVPRSSPLWKPNPWTRSDLLAEMRAAETFDGERALSAQAMKDASQPEPSPSHKRLDRRWRDLKFSDLLDSEKNYINIWALRAEVLSGGFDQYFYNSSGDHASETLEALTSIGSRDVQAILAAALQLLETAGGYSTDRYVRWDILSQLGEDAFADLNSRFYDTSEDTLGLAFRLVEVDYAAI